MLESHPASMADGCASREPATDVDALDRPFRQLFEGIGDAVVVYTTDGRFLDCNEEAPRRLGYSRDEFLALKPLDVVHPDFRLAARANQRKIRMDESTVIESVHVGRDGLSIPVEVNVRKIDYLGQPAVLAVIRDISERKIAEQALKASEARWRSLAESVPETILEVGFDGRILFANRGAFGLAVSSLVGGNVVALVPKNLRTKFRDSLEKVRATKTVESFDLELVGERLPIAYFAVTAGPVLDDGEVISIIVVLSDVTAQRSSELETMRYRNQLESLVRQQTSELESTNAALREEIGERRRSEEAYRRSDQLFRQLADNLEEVLWIVDAQSLDIVYVSPAYRNIWQRESSELLTDSRAWLAAIHPEDQERVGAAFQELVSTRDFQAEYRIVRPSGEIRWIRDHAFPVSDDQGRLVRFVGTAIDVTASKQIEEQLRRSLVEKEVLLKEIHHRVKNNLQVISSLLELQSSYVEDSQARSLFSESQNRVRSMALIHELLYGAPNLAHIDFGQYLTNLAHQLVASYASPVGHISLETDFDEIFLSVEIAVPCGLIVNELVTNALRHGFAETRSGVLKLGLHRVDGHMLRLTVWDDGVGIPPGLDVARAKSLGLLIVSTLARQIRGEFSVNGERGTEFSVTFADPAVAT